MSQSFVDQVRFNSSFGKNSCCFNPVWSELFVGYVNMILLKVLSSIKLIFSNKTINQW